MPELKCCIKFFIFLFFTFCQLTFGKGKDTIDCLIGNLDSKNFFVDCGIRGIDRPGTIRRVSTVGDSLAQIQEVSFKSKSIKCFIFGYFSGLGWLALQETHQVESKITAVEL